MKLFWMKSIAIFTVLVFALTACSKRGPSSEDPLEGHWMDEQGNTITFIGDGSVMWYGSNYAYTIYDTDKVIIKDHDTQIGNYLFTIDSEILELKDLDLGYTKKLYGSENKQEEILKEIEEAELAQTEIDMKEEQEYYNTIAEYEYETELELCNTYKEQCIEKYNQSASEADKAFYQSETDAIQERIDVLKTKNIEKIDAHSFTKACDWISSYILPEDIATSEKLIFDDEGRQYVDNTTDNSCMIAHMVRVRIDNGATATTYGSYAVRFSTMDIYEYNVADDNWEFIYSLNILEN